MSDAYWIYTTWPDIDSARRAAGQFISEGLCACTNILPGAESHYLWDGKLETSTETVMILKTGGGSNAVAALRARFEAIHPYDTPCFLALQVNRSDSSSAYLEWLAGPGQS